MCWDIHKLGRELLEMRCQEDVRMSELIIDLETEINLEDSPSLFFTDRRFLAQYDGH